MRVWADDDPKAELMRRKQSALLKAAKRAFLDEGFAGSSVNRIAVSAGVSIATLYRHFDNKTDLFVAVFYDLVHSTGHFSGHPWRARRPLDALTELGTAYLRHIHTPDRRALMRVMAQEAHRVPGMLELYKTQVVAVRSRFFRECVDEWPAELRAKLPDVELGARLMVALLHGPLLEDVIFSDDVPDTDAVRAHASLAAASFLAMVDSEVFL